MTTTVTVYDDTNEAYVNDMPLPKRFRRPKVPLDTSTDAGVIEILYLLYRYRYLNSEHIALHLPHRSNEHLRKTLRRMFLAHLVDRPLEQLHYGLGEFLIYSINKRGYVELENAADVGPSVTPHFGSMRLGRGKEFRHSLMICETLSNIELGAREAGHRFIGWEEILHDGEAFSFLASYDYPTARGKERVRDKEIIPDALFGIDYGDGRKAYFAVEAQNTSPNQLYSDKRAATRSSALKKYLSYRDIVGRRLYRKLGIKNMRVLVLAPSDEKLSNHLTVLAGVTKESHLFLHRVVPLYGANYNQPRPNPDLYNSTWLRVGLNPEGSSQSCLLPEYINGTSTPADKPAVLPDLTEVLRA